MGVTIDGVLLKDNDVIINNNESYQAKQAGGTAKDLITLGTDDILKLSQMRYQDLTTNSTKEGIFIQCGWSFVNNDGSEASSKTITYPTAFTTVLAVIASLNGENATGSDPTAITDSGTVVPTDTVQTTIGVNSISTTTFAVTIKRTAAASGRRDLFSWIAIGI